MALYKILKLDLFIHQKKKREQEEQQQQLEEEQQPSEKEQQQQQQQQPLEEEQQKQPPEEEQQLSEEEQQQQPPLEEEQQQQQQQPPPLEEKQLQQPEKEQEQQKKKKEGQVEEQKEEEEDPEEEQKLSPVSVKSSNILKLSSMTLTEPDPRATPEKKLIKVAFIGRPNAGKSTLINKILNLNICGVSHKSHTTRNIFKTSFTENNTQIVFMDTPGLITAKEFSRFNLTNNYLKAVDKSVINEVDIIGIIHEVHEPRDLFKYPLFLIQQINDLFPIKPLFLVLNKVDLILNKSELTSAMNTFKGVETDGQNSKKSKPEILNKFSEIFFTSAIQNKGVREIVDYLIQQAKPGAWLFEADEVHNTHVATLILELLRAQFMNNFPQEVPYHCKYEIEYLKENDFGEIICVGLVTCKYAKHVALITSKRKKSLRILCKQLESDLFKILGKVFRIRVFVRAEAKQAL